MGLARETKNKILAVSHFHSRSEADQDYSEPQYRPNDMYGNDYAPADMHNDHTGLKLRGLTEKKRPRSTMTQAAPRPTPPYQYSSSNSGSNQRFYYSTSSQSASASGSGAFYQGYMQASPPMMNNSTFVPSNEQYQSCNSNQGFVDPNANQTYQSQGQQHQQHQQNYTQGYSQNNNHYASYGPLPNQHTSSIQRPSF